MAVQKLTGEGHLMTLPAKFSHITAEEYLKSSNKGDQIDDISVSDIAHVH